MSSFLCLVVWRRKRASDDDIIVNVRWELGDLIIDCPIDLGDGDTEKEQRPRVRIHCGGPWHKHQATPVPFYTSWISIDIETLRMGYIINILHHRVRQKIARKDTMDKS